MDVCTLSSTHLPFLYDMLERERPDVKFIDPAPMVARQAAGMIDCDGGNTLRVYASSEGNLVQNLQFLGYNGGITAWGPFGNRG